MEEQSMRVFFAIDLNDEVKRELSNSLHELKKKCNSSIRWSKENQFHLTLRFLGNLTPQQIEELYQSFESINATPFDLEFRNFIVIPHHKPRVVALSVHLSTPLAALVAKLNALLLSIGFEAENRVFLPHITVGRIIKPRRDIAIDCDHGSLKQHVNTVTLFKSELTPEGSVYTPLKNFPLALPIAS